jgi:hypothetical protein
MTISTSLTARFSAPTESPEAALARWRAHRPSWLPERYQEIDGAYNSVTWEWRHTPLSMRFVPFAKMFGGQTAYRLTAVFRPDDGIGCRITVNGSCDESTHRAIAAAAEQVVEGGVV